MSINLDKTIFANIAWMKYYQGKTSDDYITNKTGGGSFVRDEEEALEETLYSEIDGKVYGSAFLGRYTDSSGKEQWRKFNLKGHFKDTDGKILENTTVLWVAQEIINKTEPCIIGWWENANLLREFGKVRFSKNGYRYNKSYNIVADSDNAYLIKPDKRNFKVGRKRRDGVGFGQSNVWYAKSEKGKEFKKEAINYVKKVKSSKEALV